MLVASFWFSSALCFALSLQSHLQLPGNTQKFDFEIPVLNALRSLLHPCLTFDLKANNINALLVFC